MPTSLKTFGIKQLENQDCISQYVRSGKPPDVWRWLSTKENGKCHGRCLPAKKAAISVTHSISKLRLFSCQKSTFFQAKSPVFSLAAQLNMVPIFKRKQPSTHRIFCILQVEFAQQKKNERNHT